MNQTGELFMLSALAFDSLWVQFLLFSLHVITMSAYLDHFGTCIQLSFSAVYHPVVFRGCFQASLALCSLFVGGTITKNEDPSV